MSSAVGVPSRYLEVDACIEALKSGRLLSVPQIKFVCEKLTEVLLTESNVRSISAPVTVVGDVHGYVRHSDRR